MKNNIPIVIMSYHSSPHTNDYYVFIDNFVISTNTSFVNESMEISILSENVEYEIHNITIKIKDF